MPTPSEPRTTFLQGSSDIRVAFKPITECLGVYAQDATIQDLGPCSRLLSCFPHIFMRILQLASIDALLALRATSREIHNMVDKLLFRHVRLILHKPADLAPDITFLTGVAFGSVLEPSRRLPYYPNIGPIHAARRPAFWHRHGQIIHPTRLQCLSQHRLLQNIKVLDASFTRTDRRPIRLLLLTAPPLPFLDLIRTNSGIFLNKRCPYLLEKVSLDCSYFHDGINFPGNASRPAIHRLDSNMDATTYITSFHLPAGSRATGVQIIARQSLVTPPCLRNLVLILPEVAPDDKQDMRTVVVAVRKSIRSFTNWNRWLPDQTVTLVGGERFGPQHFGVDPTQEDDEVQEATRRSLLEGQPSTSVESAYFDAVSCMSWAKFCDGQAIPELKEVVPCFPFSVHHWTPKLSLVPQQNGEPYVAATGRL